MHTVLFQERKIKFLPETLFYFISIIMKLFKDAPYDILTFTCTGDLIKCSNIHNLYHYFPAIFHYLLFDLLFLMITHISDFFYYNVLFLILALFTKFAPIFSFRFDLRHSCLIVIPSFNTKID